MIAAKYTHTNLIACNWQALARFYQEVFGCEPVPPERDLSGAWLDAATGLPGAHLHGAHLRLPGWGASGPTLEVFEYETGGPDGAKTVNRTGFGHIAFQVEDVETARQAVMAAGGSPVGDLVTVPVQGAGTVTFVYMKDPEGNIIELQRWDRRAE